MYENSSQSHILFLFYILFTVEYTYHIIYPIVTTLNHLSLFLFNALT